MDEKQKAAGLSVISNTVLILFKLVTGVITGSVSIISEAIHSSLDLLAALIAFISVRVSGKPPDEKHPYGHGKIENISGVIEALLIVAASAWIIYEAVMKLQSKTEIEMPVIGVGVMMFSAAVNYFVSRRLYKVARKTGSIALEADALHLKADVYTSLGVSVGLALILLTGVTMIDSIVAILVAVYILWKSFALLKKAFNPLIDTSMEPDDLEKLNKAFAVRKLQYHDLKTRISGRNKFAELHLTLPGNTSLEEAHKTCDEIEDELQKIIPYFNITIHVEPDSPQTMA